MPTLPGFAAVRSLLKSFRQSRLSHSTAPPGVAPSSSPSSTA